ncbi:MAG: helix-turn-helix domain-containing protein [Spirochaetota bacterium]
MAGSSIRKRYTFTGAVPPHFHFLIQRARLTVDFEEHIHSFHELVVITGGTATHRVDGRDYFVKAGDIYVFTGNRSHGFFSPKALDLWNIEYAPDILSPVDDSLRRLAGYQALFRIGPAANGEAPALILSAAGRSETDRIIERIADEYNAKRSGYEALVTGLFIELVTTLSRLYVPGAAIKTGGITAVAIAASHIESHFRERITMRELSQLAGVTERHVNRLFSEYYGVSPIDYCIRLRVLSAARDLISTESSITDIAYDNGFSDSNYFARCFRRSLGVSPRRYRETNGA